MKWWEVHGSGLVSYAVVGFGMGGFEILSSSNGNFFYLIILTVAKEPVQCKLVIDGKLLEQVTAFKYLGGIISSDRTRYMEVRHQTNNATRISGLLRDVTWRNKYMTVESKIKIYTAVVRPIMTYGAETRAANTKTKQLLRTTEMNTSRAILDKTSFDRMKNHQHPRTM